MNINDTVDDGVRVMSMKPWYSLFALTVFLQIPAAGCRFLLGYGLAEVVGFALHRPLIPWLCAFVLVVRYRTLVNDEGGRWLLGYVAAVVVDLILGLPFGPVFYAICLAVGPLVWSVAAFRFPGSGWWWHRKVGAREPSKGDPSEDEWETIQNAVAALGARVAGLIGSVEYYVIDYPYPIAVSRGRALVVSTGLLNTDAVEGPLAHEVWHLGSVDARLSAALDRLTPWDIVLPPSEEDYRQAGSVKRFAMDARMWLLRASGGRVFLELEPLQALWAKDFRRREEAADQFVVRIGLNETLADFLETYDEPRELPNPRGLFDYRHHPPTKHRIAALRKEEPED